MKQRNKSENIPKLLAAAIDILGFIIAILLLPLLFSYLIGKNYFLFCFLFCISFHVFTGEEGVLL